MKTEREIRKKLSQLRSAMRKQANPNLWRTMELQIYETILMWVLNEKHKRV